MNKRNEWVFEFSAEEVLVGALMKQSHHYKRFMYWQAIRVSIESLMSAGQSASGKYEHAQAREAEHKALFEQYSNFVYGLDLVGQTMLPLTVEDIRFFDLVKAEEIGANAIEREKDGG